MSDIEIDFLASHPEFAEELARWSWEEWREIYEERGETFADSLRKFRERRNIDSIPLALVALAESGPERQVIGTVSLKHEDLPTRPELTPWLGAVFVAPEWRGRGVATRLMERAVKEAARLKIARLYLWTHAAEGLYAKLGWEVVERTEYCGMKIVVMGKEIDFGKR